MLRHRKLECFVLFCECGGSALFVHLGRAAIFSSARLALFPLLYQGNIASSHISISFVLYDAINILTVDLSMAGVE